MALCWSMLVCWCRVLVVILVRCFSFCVGGMVVMGV